MQAQLQGGAVEVDCLPKDEVDLLLLSSHSDYIMQHNKKKLLRISRLEFF